MTRPVAIVTGAGRGIGAATVLMLVADGWSVLAVDSARDNEAVAYPQSSEADLAAVVDAAGRHAEAYVADVRDVVALEAAVATAVDRWGGVTAAVGAAAVIAGGAPLWQVPIEQQQAVLDIDLGGVINLARAAIPAILAGREPRNGRFIAVASAAATRGLPLLAAYCAAKAGVAGLVRSLAHELAGTGVTANAVSPGSTRTAMLAETARLYGLDDAESFAAQQPIKRLLEPEEVASMIAYLASSDAAAVTGAVIPVDGGLAL